MPPRRPVPVAMAAPVAMAVSFVPDAAHPYRAIKALHVVDVLNAEGVISLRPQILDPDDLLACGGEAQARIGCLAGIAAKSGPQAVAVVAEHPGWVSMASEVTCVGPNPAWAQVQRIFLIGDEGTISIVPESLKVSMAACLIRALRGPAQAE